LAREECALAQGKKVGGAVAGTRPAGARPATKSDRLGGSGHSLPRENDAGSVTPPAENACRQIQPATTSKGDIQPKHDTSGSALETPSALRKDAGSIAGKNIEPLKSWARSTVPALAGVTRTEEINDGEIQTQEAGKRR
jgi:hypothetical protein